MANLLRLISSVIVLLMFTPIVYSMDFNEFKNSYDYALDSDLINITAYSIKSCSMNCDNLTFIINATLEPGNYEIGAFFSDKSFFIEKYFFGGHEKIELVFYPEFKTNISSLSLIVKKEELNVYNKNFENITVNLSKFRIPKINITSEFKQDNNLFFNLSVSFLNKFSGKVKTEILSNANNNHYYFEEEFNNVSDAIFMINITPYENSNFTISRIWVGNLNYEINYHSNKYNFSKVDLSNDELINGSLVLTFNNKFGDYFDLYLFSDVGDYISKKESIRYNASFSFETFNSSGIYGRYKLFLKNDKFEYFYFTKSYIYSNFEDSFIKPNISDNLTINYTNSTSNNTHEFNVTNITSDIFNQSSSNDADSDKVLNDVDNCPNAYNPSQIDSDDDLIGDACDFCQNDLLNNCDLSFANKTMTYLQQLIFGTNPFLSDSDSDGLLDEAEITLGTDPTNPDTDGDGFLDGVDISPSNPDANKDGVLDGFE